MKVPKMVVGIVANQASEVGFRQRQQAFAVHRPKK
jgi:hypothetical protein